MKYILLTILQHLIRVRAILKAGIMVLRYGFEGAQKKAHGNYYKMRMDYWKRTGKVWESDPNYIRNSYK